MFTDDRGQVGISFLIVFIALVLVAAIAAGLFIQQAGVLEERAAATGDQATSEVADQLQVVSAYGEVDTVEEEVLEEVTQEDEEPEGETDWNEEDTLELDEDDVRNLVSVEDEDGNDVTDEFEIIDEEDGVIEYNDDEQLDTIDVTYEHVADTEDVEAVTEVTVAAELSAGANEIDLGDTTIDYFGDEAQSFFTFTDGTPTAGEEFNVDAVQDPNDSVPVLSEDEDVFTVTLTLDEAQALDEGDEATMTVNTATGGTRTVVLEAPNTFNEGETVDL